MQEEIQICLNCITETLRLRALEALLLSDCLDGELEAKQAYYSERVAKELQRLKPGDVVHEKLRPNAREWTKAAVDKEVDIRSHQVCTEDG